MARRVVERVTQPMRLSNREVFVTTSIGIATYPEDGDNAETLLKHADTAMYHAKAQGKNTYQFFRQSMNDSAMERLTLEGSLRKAQALAEFKMYYQPQVNLDDGRIESVEALLRWQSAELGPVSPAKFIPIAEDTGLIIDIGAFTIGAACKQLMAWKRNGRFPTRVAVNVSLSQLKRGNLVSMVESALNDSGLSPIELELELTESTVMENSDEVIETMHRLKEMGVRISVDDFGTGYSSLSYLKQLPIDTLKIDRSFIKDLPESKDSAAITSAIIDLARRLSLEVVAEGVETEAQRQFLAACGCDVMQGFLISPPVPADEVESMFEQCFAEAVKSSYG